MYEEKDYILRLIRELIRMLSKLLLGKDFSQEEEKSLSFERAEQYKKLVQMIDDGDITLAEDQLTDYLNEQNPQYLQIALLLYGHINEKTETFLTKHDFSRAEILEGIQHAAEVYGYGTFVDTFLVDGNERDSK